MPATAAHTLSPALRRLRERLLDGLHRGLARDDADDADSGFDPGYSAAEVDDCARIVDDLLVSLHAVRGRDADVTKVVRATIDRLNELNERSDCALIEAGPREDLCDLINAAAREAGLAADADEDITEAWREW